MNNCPIANQASAKEIIHNFDIRKNIPIDKRFIIMDIDNIETLLPYDIRYSGLIFFGYKNTGTTEEPIYNGKLYYFDDDLTTPKSLLASISNVTVHQIGVGEEELSSDGYSNLISKLTDLDAAPGAMIQILPLGIVVINDGVSWKCLTGNYTVDSPEQFLTIPIQLRKVNSTVYYSLTETVTEEIINEATGEPTGETQEVEVTNNYEKIILSSGELSDIIITLTGIETELENNRYYSIDGILHYSIGNELVALGNKSVYIVQDLTVGNNEIVHSLGSTDIFCLLRINTEDEFSENKLSFPIEYKPIDGDRLIIKSSLELNVTLFLNINSFKQL